MACVLEAGDGVVAFERVAQCVDAHCGVCSTVDLHTTERIVGEAANTVQAQRQRLLTVGMDSSWLAYLRLVMVLLPLSASHSALMPTAVYVPP